MVELTKNEERIMRIIWDLKSAFVKDILDKIPETPKPPYNTISSIVRLLVKKDYLGFKAYGKTYEYFPIIAKASYRKQSFKNLFSNYFDGSAESMLSYIVKEENLSEDDIKRLMDTINKK